jgi:hypothetical protein
MTRLSANVVASPDQSATVGPGAECMSFPHARLFRAVHHHCCTPILLFIMLWIGIGLGPALLDQILSIDLPVTTYV